MKTTDFTRGVKAGVGMSRYLLTCRLELAIDKDETESGVQE